MNLLERDSIERARNLLNSFQTVARRTSLSILKAITAAAQGRYRHGAPEEYEAWGCVEDNPQRFVVPFADLRDLNTSVGTAGGFERPAYGR